MPEFWDRFEGFTTGGYVLGKCLHGTRDTAYFEAVSESGAAAIARLVSGEGAGAQRELWKRIGKLSHPRLLRLLDAGWVEWEGGPLAYAVIERPDESLGDVLGGRALTAEEAGQALLGASEALAYLHGQGFVYGELGPWSIVASGEIIKLPCDCVRPAGDACPPAADVGALGLAACEMLTRRVPQVSAGVPQFAPEELPAVAPFEKLIRNCLREGDGRWTAARAAAFLRDPQADEKPARPAIVPPAAAVTPPAPARPRSPRPATRAWRVPRWTYGLAAVGALATALFLGARSGKQEAPPPVPPEAAAAVPARPVQPAPLRALPKEAAGAAVSDARLTPERVWRVIAYTFNGLGPAEKKAQSINRRWPQFKAEVFAPERHRGPYLISLNGRMTRDEAVRVQHTARAKGLPRDTYVQNYRRP